MSTEYSEKSQERRRKRILEEFPEPDLQSRQYLDNDNYHDDARDMRERFGVPPIDWQRMWSPQEARGKGYAEAGRRKYRKALLPNIIKHSWVPEDPEMLDGGTDWLCVGPPGSGKTNTALWLCIRLMAENDEKVIWRASTSRSEWLPFAPWARVCLPEGIDVQTTFVPKNPTQTGIEIELEDIVREVVRYRDPIHLNHELLKPGQFHVVYPDPQMRRLQAIYEADKEKEYDGLEFSEDDPTNHWWFGWMLARISEGPHHWSSVIFDEIGDIAPEAARNDEYAHYQKVELLRDCWVDARKTGHSVFAFGHSEADIHSMIRRKIRWRVTMAGTANPTRSRDVVGFNNVPMEQDIMSDREIGAFLPYNESEFQFPPPQTKHIPKPVDMTLKVTYV